MVEFRHRFVGTDKDVVILYSTPKSFNHNVVQCTTFTIHADPDIMALQNTSEGVTGILTALIGIEDFRPVFGLQSILQTFDAKGVIQAITKLPTDHIATRPVNHCREINMTIT